MGNRLSNTLHLEEHGLLIGGEYLLCVFWNTEGIDDCHRGRQGHLKTNSVGDIAPAACIKKILVGGPSFARVPELTEVQILWPGTVRQAKRYERDTGLVSWRNYLQVGVGA